MLQYIETAIHDAPPRRHSKNDLESKQSVVRSGFLRLLDATVYISRKVAAQHALRRSSILYENSIVTAFEMARAFSRPLINIPHTLSDDINKAQKDLMSKPKLKRILQRKYNVETVVSANKVTGLLVHDGKHKHTTWYVNKFTY